MNNLKPFLNSTFLEFTSMEYLYAGSVKLVVGNDKVLYSWKTLE